MESNAKKLPAWEYCGGTWKSIVNPCAEAAAAAESVGMIQALSAAGYELQSGIGTHNTEAYNIDILTGNDAAPYPFLALIWITGIEVQFTYCPLFPDVFTLVNSFTPTILASMLAEFYNANEPTIEGTLIKMDEKLRKESR